MEGDKRNTPVRDPKALADRSGHVCSRCFAKFSEVDLLFLVVIDCAFGGCIRYMISQKENIFG